MQRANSSTILKMIKTQLRNRLGVDLSHLMKIAIESLQTLSEEEREQIVDVWNRKSRRQLIPVKFASLSKIESFCCSYCC